MFSNSVVACGPLNSIAYGEITYYRMPPEIEMTATYSCNEGYYLEGDRGLVCVEDSEMGDSWNPLPPPTCEGIINRPVCIWSFSRYHFFIELYPSHHLSITEFSF